MSYAAAKSGNVLLKSAVGDAVRDVIPPFMFNVVPGILKVPEYTRERGIALHLASLGSSCRFSPCWQPHITRTRAD